LPAAACIGSLVRRFVRGATSSSPENRVRAKPQSGSKRCSAHHPFRGLPAAAQRARAVLDANARSRAKFRVMWQIYQTEFARRYDQL